MMVMKITIINDDNDFYDCDEENDVFGTTVYIVEIPCCRRPFSIQLFTRQSQLLTNLKDRAFENIVGKGENAGIQHFLLFPQCFLPFPNQSSIFHSHFFL